MTLAAGNSVGATARGDIWQDAWRVAPGPFLHFFHSVPVSHGPRDYLSVAIAATAPQRVAIEQFDASASRPVAGFGAGWHEQELDPRTGRRWRWLSERGELVIERPLAVAPIEPPARPMLLHVEGESPRKYYSRGSRLTARTGSRVVFDRVLDDDFSVDVPIDIRSGGVPESVVLETDQTYVPAERSRRTQDRRRLGLRIFTCVVRQAASAPDTTASSRPAR
jgi:hypothetical protein